MANIYVGKIINTFGIKGELKVFSDFDMPDKVFVKGNEIIINDNTHEITNIRYHKNHYLMEIDNIKDINEVLSFKKNDIYVLRDSLNLKEGEYLMNDLIDMEIYDNNELIGKVTNVIRDDKNPLIRVNNEFYIPLKANYIKEVNLIENRINTENAKELII